LPIGRLAPLLVASKSRKSLKLPRHRSGIKTAGFVNTVHCGEITGAVSGATSGNCPTICGAASTAPVSSTVHPRIGLSLDAAPAEPGRVVFDRDQHTAAESRRDYCAT
jgi:hypothetical protein